MWVSVLSVVSAKYQGEVILQGSVRQASFKTGFYTEREERSQETKLLLTVSPVLSSVFVLFY